MLDICHHTVVKRQHGNRNCDSLLDTVNQLLTISQQCELNVVDFLTVYINCDLLLGNIHQPDNVCQLKSIYHHSASIP